MADTIKFGYWPIRGRAQPSRLILSYCGLKFDETTYTPNDWFGKDKQGLGIQFPNLPYLIDGDVKITQSLAIPKYIVRRAGKLDLLGKTPQDMALVDSFMYAWEDILTDIVGLCFSKKWEDERAPAFYKLKSKLQKVENFVKGKEFSLGYLTIADFLLAEGSYYMERNFYEEYNQFKSIHKIRELIENLPSTVEYYKRGNAIKDPFLSSAVTTIPMGLADIGPKKEIPLLKQSSKSPTKKPAQNKPAESQASPATKEERKKEEEYPGNGGSQQEGGEYPGNGGSKQETGQYPGNGGSQQETGQYPGTGESKRPPPSKKEKVFRIVAISGSLRKASTNSGLIRACIDIDHPEIDIEWIDISQIPVFNEDLEQNIPRSVVKMKDQIRKSDAILFAVPENNYNVSAALKNAYDWASRGKDSPVNKKLGAMVSSAEGKGGLLAQKAFRQTVECCKMKLMQEPEILIKRFSAEFFDDKGTVIHEETKASLKTFLNAFVDFVRENKT